MRNFLTLALLCSSALASTIPSESKALMRHREAAAAAIGDEALGYSALEKRKGGGGKGGGSSSSGSSSSGSSSSGSSGSSGGSSGSSSSGSSSSSSSGARSGSSNVGGSSSGGSGVRPSYGGYYGGGARTPYTAGGRSPSGLLPIGLLAIGSAALIFPGLWLYGAYQYHYSNPYTYYNQSAGQNQTKPIDCFCQQYSVCGCDDNTNSTYMDSVIGNGDYNALNKSLVTVADVNGTSTILLNGTLPNGTTSDDGTTTTAGSATSVASKASVGYTLLAALVFCFVWI